MTDLHPSGTWMLRLKPATQTRDINDPDNDVTVLGMWETEVQSSYLSPRMVQTDGG